MVRVRLLLVAAACSVPDGDYFGRVPDDVDTTHFRWCNQGEPDHLDPALASSTASATIVDLLFDGLTVYDMHGTPTPGLAASWDISPDQRAFTFHLRRDAKWSNGRGVTAYDVAFSALRELDPRSGSPNADTLLPVANAKAFYTRDRAANRRVAAHELALRDLGAPIDAAYARVPAGGEVWLLMQSGGRATLPSPDGRAWSYVTQQGGAWGWVPADELAPGDWASPEVLGIDVPDPYTIRFTTADPTPYFVDLTANRALRTTPIEAVSRAPDAWTDPARIVTSGPYRLAAWIARDRIELERAPTYRDPGEVKTERITIYPFDDQAAATNFYFAAGCDATASNAIPSTWLPVMAEHRYKDYRVSPYLGVYFLWVNTQVVANRHLRRALSLAIDRTAIPRITYGGETPTAQLTPGAPIASLTDAELAACGVSRTTPGVALLMADGLCYVPPLGLDYDPAEARRELAAATAELGTLPALHYRYNTGSEGNKLIAEYLQSQWAAIGLDVQLEAQEWNAMLADTAAGKYEIARFGTLGSAPDTESDFLPLFRCGTPDNRGKYCSADFERLMTEVGPLVDRRARNAKLREAEAVMLADAPVIPLYVYTQKHLIKPYVHDYADSIIDQPPLWRVWLK